MPQNELIEFLLGSTLVVSKSADPDRCVVKGFASTPDVDLHGHTVNVSSFNWNNWPQLLEEHKGEPVGQIMTLNKAFLSEIGDIDNWGVFDSESGEQINTYPRENAPDYQNGTLGLFVTAEVTKPEVVEKAKSGIFKGFSWRGLTHVLKNIFGIATKYLTDIDLAEISLVAAPANPNAKFVVAKSLGDPNSVFDDGRIFPTYEETEEIQKADDDSNGLGSGLGNDPDLTNLFPEYLR
ncbi:hypothetical protein Pan97_30100 [Bremerella volcania]|uniref:Uncharacterized protein n=1 Tax=Bremerella volcania TaxID=2527984 RepID=A0A518C9R0_9BACT|nr:hypothetical protein [Bremerella volcania]QDU75966.1 hypothetical protein Pan97_30100 [Bremerella volcania]